MAIIISGKSVCPLCNKILMGNENVVMFPPFIQNKKDPFYLFNDSAVHLDCLKKHPLGDRAINFWKKTIFKTRPENRFCDIGGNKIETPENFLFIDLLTSDDSENLSKFNFMNIDKKNICKWKDRENFILAAERFITEGKWETLSNFNYLKYLIQEVKEPTCY